MKRLALLSVIILLSCVGCNKKTEEPLPVSPSGTVLLSVFNELVYKIEDGLITSNHIGQHDVVVSGTLKDTMNFTQVMLLSPKLLKNMPVSDSLYIVQQLHEKKDLDMGQPFTIKTIQRGNPEYIEKLCSEYGRESKYCNTGYYIISKPFLNIAKDKAILVVEYHYPDEGWGNALIFERKDNQWIMAEQLSLWDR